jgi:cohesin complex subunit SCC1
MLPDRITPYDNLELLPPPDPSWLASQIEDVTATPLGRRGRASQRDINLQEDYNNSQFLNDSLTQPKDDDLGNMDDLDLELDFGMDLDEPRIADTTIEMGREAPEARPVGDDLFSQLDIEAPRKDLDEGQVSMGLDLTFDDAGEGVRIAGDDGDILMGDDDMTYDIGDQSVHPAADAPVPVPDPRARISESPLSDVDEEFAREVELEYSRHQNTGMYEPAEDEAEETIVAPQRHRKKKLLQPDEQTMLSSTHIKEQQTTRDNILKPQSFLSKDPYVLALLNMQKTGDFVQEVLLEKRSAAWAPELRGLLSIVAARPSAAEARKRKRDNSGIAVTETAEEEEPASKSPRLELPEDDTVRPAGDDTLGNQSIAADGTVLDIPGDDSMLMIHDDDHEAHAGESREGPTSPAAHFDETVAPIVHPADSGPVSIATKHAVHILRDLFGPEAATNDDVRKNSSVVFQELLPENRTTKADATKMFFECLVLATKDAVKVEQPEGTLGGPIRIRGKRGLWGDWAEREAGGEIASQEMEQQQEERNQPESAVQSSAAVAVSA